MNICDHENLLVEFFVSNFIPKWETYDYITKIRVSFLYYLYVADLISKDQLNKISIKLNLQLLEQNKLLICAFDSPLDLVQNKEMNSFWTNNEKLLLL